MWVQPDETPESSRNSVRRRAQTRRQPTTRVVPMSSSPVSDRRFHSHLRRANQPRQPSLGVPGRSNPRCVEWNQARSWAYRRSTDVRRRPSGPASSNRTRYGAEQVSGAGARHRRAVGTRERVERLERDDGRRLVRRRLTLEPDVAGPLRIEYDEGHGQPLVLLGGVLPRVVELMEDVGIDAARAPLAVERLGGRLALDRDVVRVDLGADAIEQDPSLTPDSRDAATRRARSCAVSSSTIAPRNWLRTCSPRPATASDTSRIASDRARFSAGAVDSPKSVGNIVRQASASVVSPFITARASTRCGERRICQERRGARHERVGLYAGVDDRPARRERRPGTSKPGPHRSCRWQRARPAGTSRASRWPDAGSLIRPISSIARSMAAATSRVASSSPTASTTEARRSRHASARSLTYDHSSSISSPRDASVAYASRAASIVVRIVSAATVKGSPPVKP